MAEQSLAGAKWRRSSYSGSGENYNCVEVAAVAAAIGIRDSKNPYHLVQLIPRAGFRALVAHIKHSDQSD
jgi:hypothetical protein